MKIDRMSAIQPIFSKAVRKEKETEPNILPQKIEVKHALKEHVQRQISEIEQAHTNMGDDDPYAQLLIEKFKSGKKLTADEMRYIRKHAPGMVDYIERITREREIYEQGMKIAPTKADVQFVALVSSQQIQKDPNPEEREIRARHLADAKHEYEQTEHYKQKPEHALDKDTNKENSYANEYYKRHKQSSLHLDHAISIYKHYKK